MRHDPKRMRLLAERLATGESLTAAARLVGISRSTATTWARRPEVQQMVERLRDTRPSGDATPTDDDAAMTGALREAVQIATAKQDPRAIAAAVAAWSQHQNRRGGESLEVRIRDASPDDLVAALEQADAATWTRIADKAWARLADALGPETDIESPAVVLAMAVSGVWLATATAQEWQAQVQPVIDVATALAHALGSPSVHRDQLVAAVESARRALDALDPVRQHQDDAVDPALMI